MYIYIILLCYDNDIIKYDRYSVNDINCIVTVTNGLYLYVYSDFISYLGT